MESPAARTLASTSTSSSRRGGALRVAGASPPRPRPVLSPLAHTRVGSAAKVASVPRSYQGRDPREASQRSRSLHRRAAASSSSSSGGDETERATTTNKRRSRSRSRKQRLLPSLEDLRPRDAAAGGDENNGDSSAAASLLSAARAAAASSSTSSPSPSSSSSSNSVLSAVALIVGSSVGAGVLALPAVSAPAGFAPSATALVGVWALLTAEALLIAEVNLALLGARKKERGGRRRRKRRGGGGAGGGGGGGGSDEIDFEVEDSSEEDAIVTLREMAKETLGERGGHFVSAAYLALSYSLMVAYISKAGELVSSALDPLLLSSDVASAAASSTAVPVISPGTGAALFTAAMGLTLFGGTAAVDGANKAMTFSLLLAYAVIVAVGGAQADWGLLTESGASDWGAAPAAIPVILLSLVYHDLVPVVCAQLRGDAAKVRTALVVGSVAPLGMFILWVAVALALVGGGASAAAANNSGLNEALSSSSSSAFVDPLAALTSSGGGAVAAAVGAFSLLAIVTSCLGTALGLSSTLTAEIRGLVAAAGAVKGEEEEKVKVKEAAAAKAAKAKKAKAAKSILPPFDPILRVLSTTLASFSEDDSSSEEEEEAEEAALLALTKTAATTTAIRVAAFALVLGPPLAASLANPGSFFGVLNAVGGYGMTALYGVLPPLMAWKLREQQEKEKEAGGVVQATTKLPKRQQMLSPAAASSSFSPPLLPGGRASLTALTTASVAVEVGRLAEDLEGWRRAASEGAAEVAAAAGAASSSSSSSFATSATSSAAAISTAFEGFLAGGDAGDMLSSSVVAHLSELLAAILPS